ncbi:L-dopachrome tautomerase-related protein [Poseidonibacter lekithochrous]|uniref:L-dopachrome tautomerase-related protein n=1 Tax=Poseidonibacter lekithochrous TaxID=1904463 RepID=UPI0008FCD06D|nr:L-dopachrome tautomerase-related protein [Poseidonibacter lekithochrous]QKJ21867.1 major royal jelly-related protein [Poseidonibacter lekithochrous]
MIKINKYMIGLFITLSTTLFANKVEIAQTVALLDERPGNIAISKEGRIFLTVQPLLHPNTKALEISAIGTNIAYPNTKYSKGKESIIKAAIGIKIDKNDNLWILDLGDKKFVVWDTKKNKLKKIIKLPEAVLTPASFLQDFAFDEKRNRIIIADMTQGDLKSAPTPAFITVNTITGKAKRIAQGHSSMMPDFEGGFALNPIAIDPTFKWVYYGALHGKKIYRIPASSFDNEKNVIKNIKEYGTKTYSDGIAADSKGNVYITDIQNDAIGLTTSKEYKILAKLPKGQSWADGLTIAANGYIYATVNQLNRAAALNNGKEEGVGPYLVVKIKAIN